MITFVADPHIANHKRHGGVYKSSVNERCTLTLDVLEKAVQRSLHLGASRMYVLGDLFDNTKPLPQIIGRVQEILSKIPTVMLLGNHEQVSADDGDNALVCMRNVCTVADKTIVIEEPDRYMLCVPFKPGDARLWLEDELKVAETLKGKPTTMCLHLGVQDQDSPFFLKGSHDSIETSKLWKLMTKYDIQSAITGNWHNRKIWTKGGKTIFQTGALVPTGFDNPGSEGYGTLGIIEGDTHTFEEIPGPRFLKYTEDTLSARKLMRQDGDLYLEVSCAGSSSTEVGARLAALQANGAIKAYSVVTDLVKAKTDAVEAVRFIASATSVEEGIANYIKLMDLPDNVDRSAVFGSVKNYLSRV